MERWASGSHSAMTAMANAAFEVSIRDVSGPTIQIQLQSGTTAATILDHEALKLPAGYRARLVTDNGKEVEPDTHIWEPQAGIGQKNDYFAGVMDVFADLS